MDAKTFARIAAVTFIAVAVTAAAIEMTRKQELPAETAASVSAPSPRDPRRESLRRCQELGEAALRDRGCLRLWADERDRFLGIKALSEPLAPQSPDPARPEVR
ncbi:putative entry exclusion protein TrbK-alt [Mesorhizobium sp. M0659]|uniref:putative entry exclusion protein TrbK-alt n=1 Tax=Mesorhizobium sp. M0659 TaxID=2956980 RepID=UPI003338E9FD